jgi:hypothetical protein
MPKRQEPPPLWLPRGSVRASLALIVVGGVFGRVTLGLPVEEPELAIAAGVLGGYGLMRELDRRSTP